MSEAPTSVEGRGPTEMQAKVGKPKPGEGGVGRMEGESRVMRVKHEARVLGLTFGVELGRQGQRQGRMKKTDFGYAGV